MTRWLSICKNLYRMKRMKATSISCSAIYQENQVISTPKRILPRSEDSYEVVPVREETSPLTSDLDTTLSQKRLREDSQPSKPKLKFSITPSSSSTTSIIDTKNSPEKPFQTMNEKSINTSSESLEPVLLERKIPIRRDLTVMEVAKKALHVSNVPNNLPCRENEFEETYKFIKTKILEESSGCIYICGVPGSGKTATITQVIRTLNNEIPDFSFVQINGMRLTAPRQAYVQIYKQLTDKKVSLEQARRLLEQRFNSSTLNRQATVLLMDEIDILINRREDVLYNIFDWSTKKNGRLVVVPIGNSLNLSERLDARVRSRLGVASISFQPYSQRQLHEVLKARLIETNQIFDDDALGLVARKVASISGDCRRALDICRRAAEIGEKDCAGKDVVVSMSHVQKTFEEMITNPKVLCIKGCAKYEKFFLQAVEAEVSRTGVNETTLCQVYRQLESICSLNGEKVPDPGIALRISTRLGSSRLLICGKSSDSIHQKIMLNVTKEDIYHCMNYVHGP